MYLLYPYLTDNGRVVLMYEDHLRTSFPLAHKHLLRHRTVLEERDGGAWAGPKLYAYARSQNFDKQTMPKLGVPSTVPSLRVFNDSQGEYYLNHFRVNGILAKRAADSWYLLGILNAPVCDFVFGG